MSEVHGLLTTAARRWPDVSAVRDADGSDTYAELLGAAGRVAAGLRARGVGPGDRVLVHLEAGRAFARILYGVLMAGATAVPVHPATGAFHLRWMLQDADPVLAVTDGLGVDSPVPVLPAGGLCAPGDRSVPEPSALADDAIALLMYTSGSTGLPRAVVCPHRMVRFAVAAVGARLGYVRDDVVFSCLPMSFDYGLYQLFLCTTAGAELVVRPDLLEALMLRQARAAGATVLPVVPSLAAVLTRLVRRDSAPTAVRLLTNTGAALGVGLADDLRAAFPGADVRPMYGMTECKRITIAEHGEEIRFPGTVGRALDGTEVTIVDSAGRPVPPGVTGEIHVRGPHVMAGYWRAAEATQERFSEPGLDSAVLRTGDFGYLDEQLRLYFVGRRDDIFKRRSVRMNTQEIEAAVLEVPGVSAAVCLPPGADGLLTVYAVADRTDRDLRAAVAARVERAKVPDRFVLLPDLPKTVNGKLDKAALRARPVGR